MLCSIFKSEFLYLFIKPILSKSNQMATSKLKVIKKDHEVFIEIENLEVASKKEDGAWTCFCPDFKLLGYSNKSKEDAFKDFEENLNAFFKIHLRDNSLENALVSFNWKPAKTTLKKKLIGVADDKAIRPKIEFTNHPRYAPKIPTRNFRVPICV